MFTILSTVTLHRRVSLFAITAAVLLAACGDQPPATSTKSVLPPKPAIPEGAIPAFTAYYELHKAARTLAPDLQTASITGVDAEGVKSEQGKYPQWKVIFVSAAKHQAFTFLYSTVEKGNVLRGINNQGTLPWAGPTQNAEPFSNTDFSIDSTAAFQSAAEKGKAWLAKNPDKTITTFALGHSSRYPAPTWFILWGNPAGGFAAYVNAATGVVANGAAK